MLFYNPVKKEYLRNLDNYKSLSVDNSIIRTYITSPIQNWMVEMFPKTLAPNVITLSGFMCIFLSATLNYVFSPRFENMDVPPIVFAFAGVSLIVYRFLDDMDGKQARRTGSSSPLGELFDHGVDALTGVLGQVPFLVIAATGPTFYTYVLIVIVNVNYIFETWTECHFGAMEFGVINSVNEGLYFASFFEIIGIFLGGQRFYHSRLSDYFEIFDIYPLNMMRVWEFAAVAALAAAIFTIVNSIMKLHYKCEKNILTLLPEIIPPSFLLFLFGIWVYFRPQMFQNYPLYFLLTFMFMFAFEISNMTLCFVLKMPLRIYSLPQVTLVGCIFLQLFFDTVVGPFWLNVCFFILFTQSCIVYGWFVFIVCKSLSEYLDIYIFTIKEKEKDKEKPMEVIKEDSVSSSTSDDVDED